VCELQDITGHTKLYVRTQSVSKMQTSCLHFAFGYAKVIPIIRTLSANSYK
jgi:hypothetical protein